MKIIKKNCFLIIVAALITVVACLPEYSNEAKPTNTTQTRAANANQGLSKPEQVNQNEIEEVDNWFNLAYQAENEKNYELALEYFDNATKYDKEHAAWAYHHMGIIYMSHLSKPDEALSLFNKALSAYPEYYEPHSYIFQIYRDNGDYEKAVHHAEVYINNWNEEEYLLADLKAELENLKLKMNIR